MASRGVAFPEEKNGAGHTIVVEPQTTVREYGAEWGKARLDREKLAQLRFIEKWSIQRLQAHFGFGKTKIKKELSGLRGNP